MFHSHPSVLQLSVRSLTELAGVFLPSSRGLVSIRQVLGAPGPLKVGYATTARTPSTAAHYSLEFSQSGRLVVYILVGLDDFIIRIVA